MRISMLAFLLMVYSINAQERVDTLRVTPEGINGYVVKEVPNLSKQVIFKNLKRWAEYNIQNAEYSNQSEIEDEYLEYNIFMDRALSVKDVTMPFDRTTGNGTDMRFLGSKWVMSFYDKKDKSRDEELQLRYQMNLILKTLTENFFAAVEGKVDTENSDW